jgi:hypothetical protein
MLAASGTDTTQAILQHQGPMLILFSRHLDNEDISWAADLKQIQAKARSMGIPLVWVSADADQANSILAKKIDAEIPVFRGDLVAIKTAARANPTLYLLESGTVMEKWSYADFGAVPNQLNQAGPKTTR